MIFLTKNTLKVTIVIFIFFSCTKQPKSKNILAIGDSNGAVQHGWVDQLIKVRPNDSILNFCIGGNTIGFDNLGRDTLNTLKNINTYIIKGEKRLTSVDKIIVMLGTNDTKAVFDSVQNQVISNFDSLLFLINTYPYQNNKPEIYVVSPPPIGHDSIMLPKYHGASARLQKLLPGIKEISKKYNVVYLDMYTPMLPGFDTLTKDGIHFKENGYKKMANIINNKLNKNL